MKFPDFKYVEVAINGLNNRNHIGEKRLLKDLTGYKESYMTYFRYNDEMFTHFQEKQSVSGYKGQAYADWLPIDIDSPDLQEAQYNLNKLIQNLEEYEIDINICRFYFSGSKGFHAMIPSQLFGAEPSEDIHKRFRRLALTLANGINIDTAVYDKTRIFRIPNTINSKSGLYKIELYPFQVLSTDINEILELAKKPGEKLEIEIDFELNDELHGIYKEPIQNKSQIKGNHSDDVKSKICMKTLMEGVSEGNRDNVGLRVATYLRTMGLTPKMIWAALAEWNESNHPSLETHELERIFEQGLQHYQFGCHDYILKSYCNKDCIFYKKSWGRF